jgi:hypothetical protein
MKGDFTRDTFDPANHFSRVLMQQGRVTLDADHNEQTAILLHYLRTLTRDLIGPYAAPLEHGGFLIGPSATGGFNISAGRYYVDGILIENDQDCTYTTQPDYTVPDSDLLLHEIGSPAGNTFWLYLDVWERHITAIEDDGIREVALGGPDTCTRAQVVWQVKALPVDLPAPGADAAALIAERDKLAAQLNALTDPATRATIQAKIDSLNQAIAVLQSNPGGKTPPPISCDTPLDRLVRGTALLAARLDPGKRHDDACVTPPSSKYRGPENQLYRVEIHSGGKTGTATFKWSRENGSVAAAWTGTAGNDLQVSSSRNFDAGSWVELTDDVRDLHNTPGPLVRLAKVDGGVLSVDPDSILDPGDIAWGDQLINPKARCWNQSQNGDITLQDGAVPVRETSPGNIVWIDLEDGLQVQFNAGGDYRPGDYWLIPARVATGGIEWPVTLAEDNQPPVADLLPPDGIEHHYAPLGFIMWKDKVLQVKGCRCDFEPLSSCFQLGSAAVGAGLMRPGAALLRKSTVNVTAKIVKNKKG